MPQHSLMLSPLKRPLLTPPLQEQFCITNAMMDLGSIDNASDVSKPVSTATQEAISLKANLADIASKFETQPLLLFYLDPASSTAAEKISLDL